MKTVKIEIGSKFRTLTGEIEVTGYKQKNVAMCIDREEEYDDKGNITGVKELEYLMTFADIEADIKEESGRIVKLEWKD